MGHIRMATTNRQKQHLLIQTIQGHAMNGDVGFGNTEEAVEYRRRFLQRERVSKRARTALLENNKFIYPNASISDIYEGIIQHDPGFAEDLDEVKAERYKLIKDVRDWVYEMSTGKIKKFNPSKLQNEKGEPLVGIEIFNHTKIKDPRSVLIGLYLAAYLDSDQAREQTQDYIRSRYNGEFQDFNIHRGICTAANVEMLDKYELTISTLSRLPRYGDRFSYEELIEKGIIFDFDSQKDSVRKNGVPNEHPYTPAFVELNRGFGVSDDAAFLYISLMYGIEAGFGFIIGDAIDTIDKCLDSIKERGEDELIGRHIKKLYSRRGKNMNLDLGISHQDVINTIFAAAVDPENPGKWPSSSQRRFLEVQTFDYPLLSHIGLIRHIKEDFPYPERIKLAFRGVPSDKFYDHFRKRVGRMIDMDMIDGDQIKKFPNADYILNHH
jgi:hypothetical protein